MQDLDATPPTTAEFPRSGKLAYESFSALAKPEIAAVFGAQLELDKQLETAKQNIAVCRDFNFLDAFTHFDTDHTGFISISELASGLKAM